MKDRNARKTYTDYTKEMSDEHTTYELIAYQDFGDCFAIIQYTSDCYTGASYIVTMIDFYCNVKPIRTFSHFNEALAALTALAYKSKPIITLPF